MSAFLLAAGAVVLGVLCIGGVVHVMGLLMDALERRAPVRTRTGAAAHTSTAVPGVEPLSASSAPRRDQALHAAALLDGEDGVTHLLLVAALEDGALAEKPGEPAWWVATRGAAPREADVIPTWRDRFTDGELMHDGAPMHVWLYHARWACRSALPRVESDLVAWGLRRARHTWLLARAVIVVVTLFAGAALLTWHASLWSAVVAGAWLVCAAWVSSAVRRSTVQGEAVIRAWRRLDADAAASRPHWQALAMLGVLLFEATRMDKDTPAERQPPRHVRNLVDHIRYGEHDDVEDAEPAGRS